MINSLKIVNDKLIFVVKYDVWEHFMSACRLFLKLYGFGLGR